MHVSTALASMDTTPMATALSETGEKVRALNQSDKATLIRLLIGELDGTPEPGFGKAWISEAKWRCRHWRDRAHARSNRSHIDPELNVWRQPNFSDGPCFGLLKSAHSVLYQIGRTLKRQSGSHKTLSRTGLDRLCLCVSRRRKNRAAHACADREKNGVEARGSLIE